MYFLFEGLDLSGKSTLCRALAEATGWPVRQNSLLAPGTSPAYERARQAHIAQTEGHEAIGRMFLDALRVEIEVYRESQAPVVQDSTILLRSIAYHRGLANYALAAEFERLLPLYPRPALAFLCRPIPEVRLHRLKGRISRGNDNPEDLLVRDQPAVFARIETHLESLAQQSFSLEVLDTSYLEEKDARAKLVDNLVGRMKRIVEASKPS